MRNQLSRSAQCNGMRTSPCDTASIAWTSLCILKLPLHLFSDRPDNPAIPVMQTSHMPAVLHTDILDQTRRYSPAYILQNGPKEIHPFQALEAGTPLTLQKHHPHSSEQHQISCKVPSVGCRERAVLEPQSICVCNAVARSAKCCKSCVSEPLGLYDAR